MAPPASPLDQLALAEFRNANNEFRKSLFDGYQAERVNGFPPGGGGAGFFPFDSGQLGEETGPRGSRPVLSDESQWTTLLRRLREGGDETKANALEELLSRITATVRDRSNAPTLTQESGSFSPTSLVAKRIAYAVSTGIPCDSQSLRQAGVIMSDSDLQDLVDVVNRALSELGLTSSGRNNELNRRPLDLNESLEYGDDGSAIGSASGPGSPGGKSDPNSPRNNATPPVSPRKKKRFCCSSKEDVVEPVLSPRKTPGHKNAQVDHAQPSAVVESTRRLRVVDNSTPDTSRTSIATETETTTAAAAGTAKLGAISSIDEENEQEDPPRTIDEEDELEDPPRPYLSPAQVTRLLHACGDSIAKSVEDLRLEVRAAACDSIGATCDAAREFREVRVDQAFPNPASLFAHTSYNTDTFFCVSQLRVATDQTVCGVFTPALLRVAAREGDKVSCNKAHFALVSCVGGCCDARFVELLTNAYFSCRDGSVGETKTRNTKTTRSVSRRFEDENAHLKHHATIGGSQFRHEKMRTRTLELVSRILADWPSRVLILDGVRASLTRVTTSGLNDPSVSVRKAARVAFGVFSEIWPKASHEILLNETAHTRQLVENANLQSHPDTRDETRWARGGAPSALARSEAVHVRRTLTDSSATRYELFEASKKLDVVEDAQHRRLAVDSPDRAGRSIAASRPVVWSHGPPPPPSPKGPAPLWDDATVRSEKENARASDPLGFTELDPILRERLLCEIDQDWKRNEVTSEKPLASYYEAAKRLGTREVSTGGRYTRRSPYKQSEVFGYSQGPEVLQYFHEEQSLSDDIEKLNLRLRRTHAESVRARVTLAYTETIDSIVTDKRNRAVGVDGVTYTLPPKEPRAASPSGSVDSTGFAEARWREPRRGWVRDPTTNEFVDADKYLRKHEPKGVTETSKKITAPSAESRARTLRRIKAEWRDEDDDDPDEVRVGASKPQTVFETAETAVPTSAKKSQQSNKGGAFGPGFTSHPRTIRKSSSRTETTAGSGDVETRLKSLQYSGTPSWTPKAKEEKKPKPGARTQREARLRTAAAEAKQLRELRAVAKAKEAAGAKAWREREGQVELRVARKEIDAQDDARALELFRLRDENSRLKSGLDLLFHERLIKPEGDVLIDTDMTPAEAAGLSCAALGVDDNDLSRIIAQTLGTAESPTKPTTKVYRGVDLRSNGDERSENRHVVYVSKQRDPLSYPGSFAREIDARKQGVGDRKKQALQLRSKNVSSQGDRWRGYDALSG